MGQLRGVMVIEAAAISIPGSIAALSAAAMVLPERVGVDGVLAPVALALSPIVLAAILVSPGGLRDSRNDISVRSRSRIRWVLEAALIGAAIVALVLLQRRGLVSSGDVFGVDPLLAATPLLLAASVGVLGLRVFPVPLRAVRAVVRRRLAPVTEVGSARAIRDPAIGAIAALALIIGVSMVMFSTIMSSTVDVSQQRAATESVGADARVDPISRRTNQARREDYFARMDAKAEARAQLVREGEAGLWADEDGSDEDASSDAKA
jgi:putative ABC transport system permease protein